RGAAALRGSSGRPSFRDTEASAEPFYRRLPSVTYFSGWSSASRVVACADSTSETFGCDASSRPRVPPSTVSYSRWHQAAIMDSMAALVSFGFGVWPARLAALMVNASPLYLT